jgi:hypothetical protein
VQYHLNPANNPPTASTPSLSNWDFDYSAPSTTIDITGKVLEDGNPANNVTVEPCLGPGTGCVAESTDTTGPLGNYNLTLTVGIQYYIRVTSNNIPAKYVTLALTAGYPTVGGGTSIQYHLNPANNPPTASTPSLSNWDFNYSSVPGGGIPGCSVNFSQSGTATAPAAPTHTYTYTVYTYKPATSTYTTTSTTSETTTEGFQSMTVDYTYGGDTPPTGVVGTSTNPSYTFDAGAYYGFDTVAFSGTASYTSTVTTSKYIGGPQAGTNTTTFSSSPAISVTPSSLAAGVCGSPSCQATIPSTYIGTGRQFGMTLEEEGYTIGANGTNKPSQAAGDSYTVTFTALSAPPGSLNPSGGNKISTATYTYSIGLIAYTSNETISYPGDYNVTWELTGPSVPASTPHPCSQGFKDANEPYFTAAGGDVVAGSGIETSCATTSANIESWNSNDGFTPTNYNQGAGTEFADIATGDIGGFASAQQPSTGPPGTSLSFSNTFNNTPPDQLGGLFGAAPCAYNYEDYEASSGATPWGGNLATTATGSYTVSGPVNLSGSIPTGNQVTLYVNGDVNINGNIILNWSGETDPNQITSLHIIATGATGDINIAPSVTKLYGVYVAQNGNINTCYENGGSTTDIATDCNSQLTVNGAFVAQKIDFWRTYGTMGTGSSGSPSVPGAAAEQFIYSPYIWLARPNTPATTSLDAISNLPPVL